MQLMRSRVALGRIGAAAIETIAWVGLATALVAILDSVAPATGLGSLYLIAVLAVAVRRGQLAALAAALLGVLILNFFFIQPLHRLTIADSENVVALAVLLLAALVVGRLAGESRERAAEAELRAKLALAREREAAMLADAATVLLGSGEGGDALAEIAGRLESAGAGAVRLEASAAPEPRPGEGTVRLPTDSRSVWLYAAQSTGWSAEDLGRIARPLARLLDVAAEREQAAARGAEAEAARRADAAKTVILHAISHDLRSPLTAIRTAAGGLREPSTGAEDREALISVVEEEADRLTRLIGNLLDLSRIEAGAVNPRTDWCDLLDVISSATGQARDRNGGHRIRIELDGELPLVRADASQLERVFSNLIENALKFSPPEEPVRISGGIGAGKVTVRVVDRGPGIAASQRAHVFEPFYSGRRGGQDGAGLGLAICRGFVEANGGEIRLQADSADGTAFAVSFPLVKQPAGSR
jgi:two-component system sensor histidine kinase KdpD